jgi:hypothetical protein
LVDRVGQIKSPPPKQLFPSFWPKVKEKIDDAIDG